jgi:hypothetical protein
MPEEGEKDDDRNRNAEQPKQNTATHGDLHCDVPKQPVRFRIVAYTYQRLLTASRFFSQVDLLWNKWRAGVLQWDSMIASVSAMEKQMNEPLETGRLYRVALTPLAALRARMPCRLTLRYVARKPRHDALHGKFVGWQAVFRTVEVMPAKEMEFGLAEEGFTATPLPDAISQASN